MLCHSFFILYVGVIYIFSKDINTFIQQGCIKLIKSDSKCIYNVRIKWNMVNIKGSFPQNKCFYKKLMFFSICRSVMASFWISAALLWRVSLCSIFPACTGAPTCGARARKDGITIAWVRKCQREWLAALSPMPRSSSFVCKVSQTLGHKRLN